MQLVRTIASRLAWLIAIWLASVASLGILACSIRLLMRSIGMGT